MKRLFAIKNLQEVLLVLVYIVAIGSILLFQKNTLIAAIVTICSLLIFIDIKIGLVVALLLAPIDRGLGTINGLSIKLSYLIFVPILIRWFFAKKKIELTSGIDLPLIVLIGVAILSLIFSSLQLGGTSIIHLLKLGRLVFLIAIFYCIVDYTNTWKAWKKYYWILFLSASLMSLYAILSLIVYLIIPFPINNIGPLFIGNPFPRLAASLWEPIFFASFLLTILPIAIISLTQEKFRKIKGLWLGIFLQVTALILTFSRAGWIAAGCGTIFLFISLLVTRNKLERIKWLTVTIIISILLLGFTLVIIQTSAGKAVLSNIVHPLYAAVSPSEYQFWSTRLRLLSAVTAWNLFKAHPLLGIGFERFGEFSSIAAPDKLGMDILAQPEPNNFILKVAAEMGTIGLLVVIWILLKVIRIIRLGHNQWNDNSEQKLFLIGYMSAGVCFIVLLQFLSAVTFIYQWIFFGMLISLAKIKP